MPRFSNHPFLGNDPLLFVIPSEAEGPAVRHYCAPLLPAHNRHQSSPKPPGKTNLPFVIPGFQEWSAEPQIPRLRSGWQKGEGRCKERAVAEPRHFSNRNWTGL